MIKHIAICDKCKKEEDMRSQSKWTINKEEKELLYHYILPEYWEEFGIMPKYTLCRKCSAELRCSIEKYIHNFVNERKE